MTKSELIERIARKQSQLVYRDVELAVKAILEHMAECLAGGGRIEIRGFGSFSLHFRSGRVGRNPKTGTSVSLPAKHVPHFKPGKRLRERVNGELSPEATAGPGGDAGDASAPPAPVWDDAGDAPAPPSPAWDDAGDTSAPPAPAWDTASLHDHGHARPGGSSGDG